MSTAELAPDLTRRQWPLGSLENILHFAQLSKCLKPKTVGELYEFLSEHHVAESWAYFIAQNETPKRGGSDRNIFLDTRDLHGYERGPIIDAEFNYDPVGDNNYVFMYGRPSARTRTTSYHLRMYMKDDLELDVARPLEAHEHRGNPQNKAYRKKVFRTQAYPEYGENKPAVFLSVLRTAASGLENFVDARDNF